MTKTATTPEAEGRLARAVPGIPLGEWNRRVGWISACLGVATGSVMGLWSFDGPLPPPAWLGEYGETARRLARLGHIAFFGLGILDLLLAWELPRSGLGPASKWLTSWAMIFGNVFLPLNLFAAATYHPLKYLLGVPVAAVFLAFILTAYGACTGKTPGKEGAPDHENPP
jgi:hypothetical protein